MKNLLTNMGWQTMGYAPNLPFTNLSPPHPSLFSLVKCYWNTVIATCSLLSTAALAIQGKVADTENNIAPNV